MENENQQEPIVAPEEMKMPESYSAAPDTEDDTRHLGVILGVLIVILVLILGGLYLWGTSLTAPGVIETAPVERPTVEENNEPESTTAEAQVETMQAVSTSNEIEAIEADIESTDLDALDAELNAIDAELDAALNAL
ncbi:MAG: hypothetical protein ACI9H6_000283 [Patiriisocius sp.]|jgi:hypothetical protein